MKQLFGSKEQESKFEISIKYPYILVDLSNLFWRNFLISNQFDYRFYNEKLIFKNALILSLNQIDKLKETFAYQDSKIYFLLDNAVSKIISRKSLDPSYKHTRGKKIPGFYETLSYLKLILYLSSVNYHLCYYTGLEADDLTFPLLKSFDLSIDKKALIVSNDLDWSRNISTFVDWYDWSKILSKQEFKAKYGFDSEPEKIKIFKTFKGDPSDNISVGCPHLPEEDFRIILNSGEDIKNIFSLNTISEKAKILLSKHKRRILLNYKLVDFLVKDLDISLFVFKCCSYIKYRGALISSLGVKRLF